MDMRDVVAGGLSGFEKLVSKIPGYRGYKEKEMRREADKLLRDHIYGVLTEQRRRIEDIQANLGLEYIESVEKIGKARRRLQTLADTVHTAAYGYAGLFDAVKVKEEQLDALYTFDEGLLAESDAVGDGSSDRVVPDAQAPGLAHEQPGEPSPVSVLHEGTNLVRPPATLHVDRLQPGVPSPAVQKGLDGPPEKLTRRVVHVGLQNLQMLRFFRDT